MSNRPTANQISLGASTNLDQVINSSGQWIGSATGLQGPQGTTGSQGVQGLQGLQGRQGAQGINGTQGVQGLLGPQGVQGLIGIQGQIGQNGIQGSIGIQGQIGQNGIQGSIGIQGQIGQNGIQGSIGIQGQIGIQGSQGLQGLQGLQGRQGVQGLQGLQGRQGVQGGLGGFTTSSNAQVNSLGVNTAASGTAGEIRATNEITAFYSDMRLKTFLGEIQEALAKIESIQGFYFHPNDLAQALGYANTRHVGLSAQEIAEILPEIIRKAPVDEEYMTLDYSKMVPLLVQAIKELNAKYDSIVKRLERLENDAS